MNKKIARELIKIAKELIASSDDVSNLFDAKYKDKFYTSGYEDNRVYLHSILHDYNFQLKIPQSILNKHPLSNGKPIENLQIWGEGKLQVQIEYQYVEDPGPFGPGWQSPYDYYYAGQWQIDMLPFSSNINNKINDEVILVGDDDTVVFSDFSQEDRYIIMQAVADYFNQSKKEDLVDYDGQEDKIQNQINDEIDNEKMMQKWQEEQQRQYEEDRYNIFQ